MDTKRYYELKEARSGVPFHVAKRYLSRFLSGPIFINRSGIIAIAMNNVFMVGRDKDAFEQFDNTFEVAANIISAASLVNQDLIDRISWTINDELSDFAQSYRDHKARASTLKGGSGSSREIFSTLLSHYADSYEGIYKCVASLPAIAKLILNEQSIPSDLSSFVHSDPKKKITIFNDDSGDISPALPELSVGCIPHLRNGINHNRWKMKNRDQIVVWDEYHGRETWRQTYSVESLQEVIKKLDRTIEALLLALWVHQNELSRNMSGRFCLAEGYYEEKTLKEVIEDVAMDMGLFLNSFSYEDGNNEAHLEITIPENLDIPQESEIYEGTNPPRKFIVKTDVIELPALEQFLNFLGTIGRALLGYSSISIKLDDEKRGHVLDATLTNQELRTFCGAKGTDVEKKFQALGGFRMKVTVEHDSVPVR